VDILDKIRKGMNALERKVGVVTIVLKTPVEFNFTLSDFGMCGDL